MASFAAAMSLNAFARQATETAAQPSGLFTPPQTPMLLTRTLRRPLPDGRQIVTRRSYEIRFVPEAGGFRIDGKLADVTVEAPEKLAALAELERNRPDTGMFPMRMDASGRLLPGGEPAPSEALPRAEKLALKDLSAMKLPAPELAQAQAFVRLLGKRRGLSQWPAELFHPVPGRHRETQAIGLPGGAQGQVTVDTEAETAGPAGLLSSFSRTVTTEVDGDMRVTYESWTLSAAG